MSTGLTFGTISALYGLTAHIINRTQFSLLVTVVVLSAIVPTAISLVAGDDRQRRGAQQGLVEQIDPRDSERRLAIECLSHARRQRGQR